MIVVFLLQSSVCNMRRVGSQTGMIRAGLISLAASVTHTNDLTYPLKPMLSEKGFCVSYQMAIHAKNKKI